MANADVTIVCPFVVLRDRKPSEPEQFVNAPLVPDSDAPDAADAEGLGLRRANTEPSYARFVEIFCSWYRCEIHDVSD